MAEFNIGDTVAITSVGEVYPEYTEFVNSVYTRECPEASVQVVSQWQSCASRNSFSEYMDSGHKNEFRVVWFRKHPSHGDENVYIVNDGNRTFIVGPKGLSLIASGGKSPDELMWEDYIRYVRNWTAVNREYNPQNADKPVRPMDLLEFKAEKNKN